MKRFILIFFIIILVLIIHKNIDGFVTMSNSERNSFIASQRNSRASEARQRRNFLKALGELESCRTPKIKGCILQNLINPNPDDFFKCHIKQCKSILGELYQLSRQSGRRQAQLGRILGEQIKNYFAFLYMYNLEKYYQANIIVTPAFYVARKMNRAHYVNSKPIKDFMNENHNLSQNYFLKPIKYNNGSIDSKNNLSITQFSGIFVPMGFKIAISNPNNNLYGSKCGNRQDIPNYGYGNCVPASLANFNKYLTGGRYYSYNEILKVFFRSGGTTIVRKRQPEWQGDYRADTTNRGRGPGRNIQNYLNYHTALDHTMKDSWLRDAVNENYAYGDPVFKFMNITVDRDFFNKFYSTKRLRDEIRREFKSGDFERLKPYH